MNAFNLIAEWEQEDEDDEEELQEAGVATVGVIAGGAQELCDRRNRRRRQRYRFLKRDHLLPNPREGTPWQRLYESRNNTAFITTMGVDVPTFDYLLSYFAPSWSSFAIPRTDAQPLGAARIGGRSLNAAGGLGLVLHYLCSTSHQTIFQLIFALVPSTAARYIKHARTLLLDVVRAIPEGEIAMPQTRRECEELSEIVYHKHDALWGAIGTGDGLELPVQTVRHEEIENATYNGWKSNHCVKSILLWSSKGEIMNASYGCPGSWHDSAVARPLYPKLRDLPADFYIICDTAFPSNPDMEGRIHVPSKDGRVYSSDPDERAAEYNRDRQLVWFRQTAEWGMEIVQGSFGRLRVPLPGGDTEEQVKERRELLELCFRLVNVRARRIEINEIRTTYYQAWLDAEERDHYGHWCEEVFYNIRRNDRVSRFHLIVEQEGDSSDSDNNYDGDEMDVDQQDCKLVLKKF